MKDTKLSVIIPTYNRADKLSICLQRLHQQSLSQALYDIWVVDDGSQDQTEAVLKEWKSKSSILNILRQSNAGQGTARNLAMQKVEGEINLFIGDDIFASPQFLEEHLNFHQSHPKPTQACLGLTLWEPPTNTFMKWLTDGGPQFAYGKLKAQEEASFYHFYTSNISVKKELINGYFFDTDFKGYGWEDIELAYRLQKEKGLQIIYWPQALATHDHYMEESSLPSKMEQIGRTAEVFQRKHPELRLLPSPFKKLIFSLGSSKIALFILSRLKKAMPKYFETKYWYWLSKRHFLKGIS